MDIGSISAHGEGLADCSSNRNILKWWLLLHKWKDSSLIPTWYQKKKLPTLNTSNTFAMTMTEVAVQSKCWKSISQS